MIVRESIPQRHGLRLQLAAIIGNEWAGRIEIRRKTRGGMAQEFIPIGETDRVLGTVLALAERSDVYVGAAPRFDAKGGRSAIRRVWALWLDCDTRTSVQALERFEPAPHLVLESGTPGNLHAWWSLRRPLEPGDAERANRRLAHYLGADMKATDAARIMRPAGTLNHKHKPPRPVELVAFRSVRRTPLAQDIVGSLPDLPNAREPAPKPVRREGRGGDPLLTISPREYVSLLAGRELGRDGKTTCPLHAGGQERSPSLHAYDDPERGWYCFGCGEGGSIYDFGAALWKIHPGGADFHRLRRRLAVELLAAEGVAA